MTFAALREYPPGDRDALHTWVRGYTGVRIARTAVCRGHHAPFEAFSCWQFERPSLALLLGPRGGGKSFLSALDTHVNSRFHPGYATRILGGSLAQSKQVYEGLKLVTRDAEGEFGCNDYAAIDTLLAQSAHYRNGSKVEILACSQRSVRGPHVPGLKLDEVDEIDDELRQAAMGMNVARGGFPAQALMTSTWHRVGGPMGGLLEQGRAGKFPTHEFCIFEVLERCPDERSGKGLELCAECPIVKWCHQDKDENQGVPRAKRSDGHYSIDALIQKVLATSARIFEADYLCLGPRADGTWFKAFDTARHVHAGAEYDPRLPVHLAVDSGVFSGAVFFQIAVVPGKGSLPTIQVRVFADYLSEGKPAFNVAGELLELARVRCNGRLDVRSTDPAGGARNPVGATVIGEYERAGLRLDRWPGGSVADGLALVESFVESADGSAGLFIHPRCTHLITAFQHYARAKRQGQWMDYPEDPQHPHEDMIDPLRGGLRKQFPSGNRPEARYAGSVNARNLVG